MPMHLNEQFDWRGGRRRWGRHGSGPAVVLCHGPPWSSRLWAPFAQALSGEFTTYLWDMAGYGESSKDAVHPVSLDIQGELLHDLLQHWGPEAPQGVPPNSGGG